MTVRSWNRLSHNPRFVGAVLGAVFLVLGVLANWIFFSGDATISVDDPPGESASVDGLAGPDQVPLGTTLKVPDASVRLTTLECGLTEHPDAFSDPKGQYCVLTISVRNDGNTVGPALSSFSWTLFVGDDKFYGEGPYGPGGLFPDEKGNGTGLFDIPPRVVPSKLEIRHYDLYAKDAEFREWELSLLRPDVGPYAEGAAA